MIVDEDNEGLWLDQQAPKEELEQLFGRFDYKPFEAVAVSKKISSPNRSDRPNSSKDMLNPVGDTMRMNSKGEITYVQNEIKTEGGQASLF